MIQGMTGYGRGEAVGEGLRVVIDVRTTNHRHLDVELRGSLVAGEIEARLRKAVGAKLARGRVEVSVVVELTAADTALVPNRALLRAMAGELRELARELNVAGELTLDHLAQLPWSRVMDSSPPQVTPEQEAVIVGALEAALNHAISVRRAEGAELTKDLRARLAAMRAHLAVVERESEGIARAHLERLRQRLAELVPGLPLSEDRLLQEAATLADKADVAEEITRLGGYLDRLDALIGESGPAGKKLDFTLQEAFREVNTLGSKARGLAVGSAVIDMKSELERMREQAANVE